MSIIKTGKISEEDVSAKKIEEIKSNTFKCENTECSQYIDGQGVVGIVYETSMDCPFCNKPMVKGSIDAIAIENQDK